MADLFEKIRTSILSLPGVAEKPHERFGKHTYYLKDREFLHFHSRSQIDVLLPEGLHSEWLRDSRVKVNDYPPFRLECDFHTKEDVEFAMKLVKVAHEKMEERLVDS